MQRYLNLRKGIITYASATVALLTAVLASTCCIAPFLAIAGLFGVSVAQLAWLASVKEYLKLLSLIAIGYSLYKAHKKAKMNCRATCCFVAENRKASNLASAVSSKTFLWIIALITLLTLLAPILVNAQSKKVEKREAQASYRVEKFKQSCCSVLIEYSLKKVKGYHKMEADANKRLIIVWYNAIQTNPKILKEAIDRSGYIAEQVK